MRCDVSAYVCASHARSIFQSHTSEIAPTMMLPVSFFQQLNALVGIVSAFLQCIYSGKLRHFLELFEIKLLARELRTAVIRRCCTYRQCDAKRR